MSTKWPQGEITPNIPASVLGGNNISGVYTLDQLNRLNADFGPQMQKSLRFRASASAYLNRTPSVAGSRTTFTYSFWVKRGSLGTRQGIVIGNQSTNANYIEFSAGDVLGFSGNDGTSAPWQLYTTQVFRDPSAWYHIIWVFDSTQATSTNRVKMYVNGVQVTAFGTATYPTQNYQTFFNQAVAHQISGHPSALYFDGYMAEINFIDGQALTPSSFGKYNATTGVWQPIFYAGTYGTNGFRLTFANNASTTTLGYDSSPNGNNWTTNNISLTAGSTYDSMLDVPTNWVAGDPIQARGNYAVLNPLTVQGLAPYNANLTLGATTSYSGKLASIGVSSGKWYWEQTIDYVWSNTLNQSQIYGGVSTASASLNGFYGIAGHWGFANCDISGATSGSVNNGTLTNGYTLMTTGGVVGLALDMDSGSLSVYRNNVFLYSVGTNLAGNTVYPIIVTYVGASNSYTSINFGQRPFAYTPPTGFKSLCTQNLPAPTIYNGANHMAATTYTGTGSSLSISNSVNSASFQPDLVWIKSRSAATDHALYDVIRGTQNRLESNTTDAAVASDNGLTAFGSAGFTVNTLAQVNTNAATYVGWQWKAGGTAVSNNAGTIASSVSANTTAGFSVVTYTGTGANATVGHGLGVAPSMVIIKARVSANLWVVYHASLGASGYVSLNSTAAFVSLSTVFNNTTPTSSVFSVGVASGTNDTNGMVAYCFAAIAGYSAFGSYTGNGSADGPFVYCGFRPKFILVKCSSTTGNWYIFDSSRNTYNVLGEQLYPNLSNAGSTVTTLDFLSNGFKMRTASDPNASATYIYAAFASNPFQNSLAF